MGQKLSTDTSEWTTNDWAFGTAANAVPIDDVVHEVSQMPRRYFGGDTIQNDASMQQMQRDLLSFDEQLKRLFFWRKKNRRGKKSQVLEEEEYPVDGEYYDQMQQPIAEEDESATLPPIYSEANQRTTK